MLPLTLGCPSPLACILKQCPKCPQEVPLLIEYFCILVPLLKAWKATQTQLQEICRCAVGMAHWLFLMWPTPQDIFAYWHTSDVEVPGEAMYAFNTFRFANDMGLGPGTMGNYQSVEALGHHILVAAELSGLNAPPPPCFLFMMSFSTSACVFATKNRMLPLLLKVEEYKHNVLGEEVGEAARCPASRRGRPPLKRVYVSIR